MFNLLRGAVQRFSVSAKVLKARSKLLVYPAILIGGSVVTYSAAATFQTMWKGNYDYSNQALKQEEKEEEEERSYRYWCPDSDDEPKAWDDLKTRMLYKALYRHERENDPDNFLSSDYDKALFNILYPDGWNEEDDKKQYHIEMGMLYKEYVEYQRKKNPDFPSTELDKIVYEILYKED